MQSTVEQVSALLEATQTQAKELLSTSEAEHTTIFVTSTLQTIINRLNFLSDKASTQSVAVDFPPVTDFFGEPINRAAEVVKEDLLPTLTEKELYLSKVDKLQAAFNAMDSDKILDSYRIPEDVQVLRHVAKRAGLSDFKEGTINIDFIDRTKQGLNDNEALAASEAAINEELSSKKAKK